MNCNHCDSLLPSEIYIPEWVIPDPIDGVCFQCNLWLTLDPNDYLVANGYCYSSDLKPKFWTDPMNNIEYRIQTSDTVYYSKLWFVGKVPSKFKNTFPDTCIIEASSV